MTTQQFLIGPIGDGLRKDIKPFATPEDSFIVMRNAFQFRGRTRKRLGYTTLGQLANGTPVMGLRTYENYGIGLQTLVAFDTTQSYEWNGTNFIALPSVMPVTWSGTDYDFFWTTNYAGAFWATNNKAGFNGWAVQAFTGAVVGPPSTVVVQANGNTVAIGDFVYFLNLTGNASANNLIYGEVTAIIVPGSTFTVQAISFPPGITTFVNGTVATGSVLDSMKTVTGQDGIRYYGILTNGTGWANYNPPIDPNNALLGALLIFPYRGYLVFLSTWEGNEQNGSVHNFGNRARWTQIGTPYYSNPVPTFPAPQTVDFLAARDDLFGRGGANDAPTSEVIVGAQFIRDILVVYFERSTWRLRFVNNAQNPFVWERINIELGSDCTFSTIPFDKGLMAIGNRGLVISDGNDTQRIDEKIPDDIFDIRQTNQGLQRVYGIRTFRTRLCYWTFPSTEDINGIYPDKVLVLNYETKNFSYYDDSFTCFGYFYPSGTGYTWGSLPDAWSSYTDVSWDSGVSEAGYENIVAGNQQGYVLLLEQTSGQNGPSLTISAITDSSITHATAVFTSINNNLPDGTWITITGTTGITDDWGISLNGRNFKVSNPTLNANTFTLTEFKPIDGGAASGTSYSYTISYLYLSPGTIQINVGTLVFTDPGVNGILVEASSLGSGTINYDTGVINLTFSPSIGSTEVYIHVVTNDPLQGFNYAIQTIGTYSGGGKIAKISTIDIQTKYFNFFKDDQRARLSKVDFYVDSTSNGQFLCNILADSSDIAVNAPLSDNPQSNIVLTSRNPYQVGQGDETLFRLWCESTAQTLQFQFTYNDYQLASNPISQSDIQINALIISMRRAGRLV
jgi:hypothetical protein